MADNKLEIGTTVNKLPFDVNTPRKSFAIGTTVRQLPFKTSDEKGFEEKVADIPYGVNQKTSFWGEVGRQLYSEPDPKNPTLMMKLLHPIAESDLMKPIINSRIVQETVAPIAQGLNKGVADVISGVKEIPKNKIHGTLKTLTGVGETLFNAIPAAQAFSVAANTIKSSSNPYISKAVDIPFTAVSSLAKAVGYKPEEDSNGQLLLGLADLAALGGAMKYMEVKGKSADKKIAGIQSQQDLTKVTQQAANGQLDLNQQKELGNYFDAMQKVSSADLLKAAVHKGTPEADIIGEKIVNAHKNSSSRLTEQEKNDMLYDFVSKHDIPAFKLKLQKLYQDGNISEQDFNESNVRLEKYENYWGKVKDKGFSNQKNKEVFDLTWKADNLKSNIEKAKADPNLENDPIGKAQLMNDEKQYDSHIDKISNVLKKEDVIPEEKVKNPISEEKQIEEDIIPVSELIDRSVMYNGEKAELFQEGKTVIARVIGSNREYEIGNIDEIQQKSIKDFGIEQEKSIVSHDGENLIVRDKKYKNNYSDPLSAINRDKEGNIISVNLETSEGKKVTFRGNTAEDIAYEIHLNELNKDNETRRQFEQYVEEDKSVQQKIVDGENEIASEKGSVGNNEKVSRKKHKVKTETLSSQEQRKIAEKTVKVIRKNEENQFKSELEKEQKINSAFAKTGVSEMAKKLNLTEDYSFEDVRKEYTKRKEEFEIKNGKLELKVTPQEESIIEKKAKEGQEIKESEASKLISEESTSPKEITEAYDRERVKIKEEKLPYKDQVIAENLNKIKQEGFERFGDKNKITSPIKNKYFDLKNGRNIDDEAMHLSDVAGTEITPADIVNHILDSEGRAAGPKENKITTSLRKRYQEVTGREMQGRDIEKAKSKEQLEPINDLPFHKEEKGSETHTSEERKAQIEQLKKAMPRLKVVEDSTIGEGKAGRLENGVVKLNPNYNLSDTPIHEFGHALIDMMGGIEHPLIQKGVNQLRDTNLWHKVEKAYPELSKDMLEKEVLATAIGKKGAGIHSDRVKSMMIKHWIDNFIGRVRRATGMTNDVARTLAKQLLSGKEIKLKEASKKLISAYQESKVLPEEGKSEYDKNYEMSKDRLGKFKVDAHRVWEQVKSTTSRMLEPIHSVLKDIHPELAKMLRETGIDIRKSISRDGKLVKPLMDKVNEIRKSSEQDYADLNLALNSKDIAKIDELTLKYKMQDAMKSLRKMYEDSFARQKASGFDVAHTQDYFHRSVKDVDGFFKYLEKKLGDKYNVILESITVRENDLGREMTKEEQANFVSDILRGYNSDKIALGKIGSMQERSIQNIDAEMNQYYHDAMYSTMKYISDTNEAIEARRFFGKGSTDIGMANQKEGISFKLLDALSKGDLNQEQLNKVITVLDARFNRKAPNRLFSSVKNIAYIDALGNPMSALTQLKDIAFSFDRSGIIKTAKALGKIVIGKHEIDIEKDLHFSEELAEFADGGSNTHAAIKKVLKSVGFHAMDKFGKNIYVNSLLEKYTNSAKNFNKLNAGEQNAFVKKINETFVDENEAKKVIQDLKRGEITEDVKFLMANELLDLQPADYSEYPIGYLKGANARVVYALKTFQLKQLDYFRQQTTKKIFSEKSTKTEKIEGLKSFFRLGSAMILMGAGVDEIKDWILRKKPTKLSDRFVDNALQMILLNKYDINEIPKQGLAKTLEAKALPPSIRSVDNASKDISDAIKGKSAKHRFVKNIPVVGTTGQIIYRWWTGKKNN